MVMFTLTAMIMSMVYHNSMIYIMSINFMTILGSTLMALNMQIPWLSLMIMLLMVGGLMILYIFVLSMNSNEKMNSKMSINMLFLVVVNAIILHKMKPSKTNNSLSKMMYLTSWSTVLLSLIAILLTMFMASKLIFHPSNPSKSMK